MQSVKGIGPNRASFLSEWRKLHEARANKTMPRSLPSATEAGIKSRHSQKRQQFQQERLQWQSRLQSETDRITGQAAGKLMIVNQNQQTVQASANQQRTIIKKQSSDKINSLVQKQLDIAKGYAAKYPELDGDIRERTNEVCQQNWRLAKANRELSRYRNVTFGAMLKRVFFMR